MALSALRAGLMRSCAAWVSGVLERRAARIESVKDTPLAPPYAWLALIAASLLAAWRIESGKARRRRAGDIT